MSQRALLFYCPFSLILLPPSSFVRFLRGFDDLTGNGAGRERRSAMSDSDEETVLRKYVKNLDKVGESWTGCLERDDVLEPMERELLTIGVSFKTVSSKHHREDSSKANPGTH